MSSSDEAKPPARDPLLDDPAFAELVDPPKEAEPLPLAEPVAVPVESLPVAEVVRPKAVPVQPVKPKLAPNITMPTPVETEPPRPQWFAACSVIGCLGVLMIAALAALIYIAITLLSNLGDKIGDTKSTSRNDVEKVQRGPLAPTSLAADTEIDLPGRVASVTRGAGGRFLLLRIQRTETVHVFDANHGRIVYQIPGGKQGTLVAASADKIFLCDPLEHKLQRYGLFTGSLESEVAIPKSVPVVQGMAIGSAASGPLRLVTAPGGKLRIHHVDPTSLSVDRTDDFNLAIDASAGVMARASESGVVLGLGHADGAVAVWFGTTPPTAKPLAPTTGAKPQWAIPSPDGQWFYTPRGVYDTGGNPFTGSKSAFYTFPTAAGSERFLSLEADGEQVSGTVRVYMAGETSMARSSELEKAVLNSSHSANAWKKDDPTAAERVHYWPAAGIVAVLPHARAQQTSKLLVFKIPVSVK
jgi:hypothetical protein